MKLRVDIAGGYKRTDIALITIENPSLKPEEATRQFVEAKYGNWIRSNMQQAADEFSFPEVTEKYFVIDFTSNDDALEFKTKIGGRFLEE